MTKNLKWRFSKMPTPDEVLKLVNDKIITKEEAREILFNEEEKTERDIASLEAEIKFLKELVEKLSNNNRNVIIETIKYVEKPYYQWNWYKPYEVWCETPLINTTLGGTYDATTTNGTQYFSTSGHSGDAINCSFSAIGTF